jgi:hypothetical protein
MSVPNSRESTINEILGTIGNIGRQATERVTSGISTTVSSPETANSILQLAFYLVLYSAILFLVLLLVHYTITPVFRFIPGSKGIIPIYTNVDSGVYWNQKTPLASLTKAPIDGDSLASYPFANDFSFSIDLYVRKLTDSNASNRILLIKAPNSGTVNTKNIKGGAVSDSELKDICNSLPTTVTEFMPDSTTATNVLDKFKAKASMIMYLTEVNDLVVSFFVGSGATEYSSKPIQNIPLYEPFRVSVVVESKLFTIYLNGKQAFQRVLPVSIVQNTKDGLIADKDKFYSAPSWAGISNTVFLQNLILTPRVLTYNEVIEAQPALALSEDFGAEKESSTNGTC